MKGANLSESFYKEKIKEIQHVKGMLENKRTYIAWLRFMLVLTTGIVIYFLWPYSIGTVLTFAIGAGIFLVVLSKDIQLKNKFDNLNQLILINQEELDIAEGNYLNRKDGLEFMVPDHPYASDLDILGKASLYQYINRCNSDQGNRLFANFLLFPSGRDKILAQQTAVKEFAKFPDWRQQFQSFGKNAPITQKTENSISYWLEQENKDFVSAFWNWSLYIFPFISIGSLLLYLNDSISAILFYPLLFLYFLFAFYISNRINKTYVQLSRIVPEVTTLYNQLKWLEETVPESGESSFLNKFFEAPANISASIEILKLKHLLNRFDIRLNIVAFYLLNTFLLWDLRQLKGLEKWKSKNASSLKKWFHILAETEVLVSISTLAFNQPEWCFPIITDEHFTFEGAAIGHPLILKSNRISNTFQLNGTGKIALITGSNMAGKSTFLRSLGVNLILAFLGAPVCASYFKASCVKVMSSMRVADNLAESTSTFYAELKKLQTIIESVNRKEKIFILLDEILRGTNSSDRHTGSKALMKQLILRNAVAVIATHDLELADPEYVLHGQIVNYHFDVQVAENELFFDYKLKQGICNSMNASILMKKIGIEF